MELSEEQVEKLQKLAKFLETSELSPNLPIVEVLEEIKGLLSEIANKPQLKIPEPKDFPEIPEVVFPDVQKVEVTNQVKIPEVKFDMSETNALLRELVDKEDDPIEITMQLT